MSELRMSSSFKGWENEQSQSQIGLMTMYYSQQAPLVPLKKLSIRKQTYLSTIQEKPHLLKRIQMNSKASQPSIRNRKQKYHKRSFKTCNSQIDRLEDSKILKGNLSPSCNRYGEKQTYKMGSYDVVYMSNILNSKSRVRKKENNEQQKSDARANQEGSEDVEENILSSLRTIEEKRSIRFCNRRLMDQKATYLKEMKEIMMQNGIGINKKKSEHLQTINYQPLQIENYKSGKKMTQINQQKKIYNNSQRLKNRVYSTFEDVKAQNNQAILRRLPSIDYEGQIKKQCRGSRVISQNRWKQLFSIYFTKSNKQRIKNSIFYM